MELQRLCMAHLGAFLIPAEYLGETTILPEVRALLQEAAGLSEEHIALFERGYSLYRQRAAWLNSRAPGSWLPPRKANVLLITDPKRVRPYCEPFLGVTWCLYLADLDPRLSHEEWVCFQIFHVERLAFLKAIRAAVCFNLSYFLVRTEDELRDFSRAASRSTRPDAPAFIALARALPWITSLYHTPLREPSPHHSEPLGHVEGADLLLPRSLRPEMLALLSVFDAQAQNMEAEYLEAQAEKLAGKAPADTLTDFLAQERPDVQLVDTRGESVYAPDFIGDLKEARGALEPLTSRAGESLLADLRIVDEKSRAVLASLRDPDILSRTADEVDLSDGVYIRADLRRIVYELRQPSFDPLREEGPPLHRQLLAARVVHEWGHLAHEVHLIDVPAGRRAEYDAAVESLASCWNDIVAALPARLEEDVAAELSDLGTNRTLAGQTLAQRTLLRIPDYASNFFFRRYLRPEELSAYVRTNVRHHLNENLGPLMQLVRHAVEFQYLSLAGIPDPFAYFLETSYFAGYFLRPGVFTEEGVRALFDATARVCACYELDSAAFQSA